MGEVGAGPVVAGGGGVPLVEDQVDDRHHVPEPGRALRPGGQLELGACLGERALGARDPLGHRRLRGEEAAGDLGGGEPADQPQGQRGARLGGERGVAREEDQPQDVVLDVVDLGVEVRHVHLLPCLGPVSTAELGDLAPLRLRTADVVDPAALGGRHQPGAGVVGDAGDGPLLEGGEERVLREVLGERDVARHPGERADEAGRLGPPGGDDGPGGVVVELRGARHRASVGARRRERLTPSARRARRRSGASWR